MTTVRAMNGRRGAWSRRLSFVGLLAVLVFLAGTGRASACTGFGLMPSPAFVSLFNGSAPLSGGVRFQWDTPSTPLLRRAVQRFGARYAAIAGPDGDGTPYVVHLRVGVDPGFLTLAMREHYTLTTTETGGHLEADGPAGLLHGLATLLQLVEKMPHGVQIARLHIDDAPRFAWRGVLIDVSRHFMTVPAIERQLDAMELVKLNVLHWHLSDSAAFRVESLAFPKLTSVGAHGRFYTQAQVRGVIAYAADRGIRVVPEFDVPGHAMAIVQAYPQLGARSAPLLSWGKPNPNNAALDPTSPEVLAFVRTLYGEMGRLFPDRYFHAGGDEVVASQWTGNPAIAAYMKAHHDADAPALQAAFTAQVAAILSAQGKIMMGWDEVSEAPVPRNVVVEAWRGSRWTASATKAGHPVVVSAGYYLDLLRPARAHYVVDPYDTQADGLDPTDFEDVGKKITPFWLPFLKDPAVRPLDDAQKSRVIGAEGALWTEMVSEEMLDGRLWPRTAALAERFWSPASVRDVADMEARLPRVQSELEATGLRAEQSADAMRDALVPGHPGPLAVLTGATVPVRNYAFNRLAASTGDALLSAPVAIAAPDAFAAIRFNALAARYAGGERGLAGVLRDRLRVWANNDAAFSQGIGNRNTGGHGSGGNVLLQDVAPVSHDLSVLAQDGLRALDGTGNAAWKLDADRAIAAQEAAWRASSNIVFSRALPQPPGGLLIAIVPGVRALVDGVK